MRSMRGPLVRRYGARTAATWVALALVAAVFNAPAGASVNRPFFSVARTLWLSEAQMVSGALQNVPLVAAAHDLERGLTVHGANIDGYAKAIATLNAFERIPLTSETPSQMSASHRDWATLNAFFDVTPAEEAVLDNDVPSGPQFDAAQHAWRREPSRVHKGLSVALLETVVANLRAARTAQPGRAIIYQAALVDAQSLEHARATDLVATPDALLDPYTQDIYYLNVIFEASRLASSTAPQ
jgi:hypothetical protein